MKATMFQRRSDGRWCIRVPVGDDRVFLSSTTRAGLMQRISFVAPDVKVMDPGQLEDVASKFWRNVDKGAGCWAWLGHRKHDGYGQFRVGPIVRRAHRVAYELTVGPVPAGLVLDHLCGVRWCVNPEHLEPVTQRENVLRGRSRVTA